MFLTGIYALSRLVGAESLPEEKVQYVELEERQFFSPFSAFNGLGALLGLGIVAGALGSYLSRGGDCKCPKSACGTGPDVCGELATESYCADTKLGM